MHFTVYLSCVKIVFVINIALNSAIPLELTMALQQQCMYVTIYLCDPSIVHLQVIYLVNILYVEWLWGYKLYCKEGMERLSFARSYTAILIHYICGI